MNDSYIKIKNISRWWRFGMAIFFTLLLAVACHHDGSIPVSDRTTNAACRNIEHAAGITCVPDNFQRLVTLDDTSFANAIALGIQPVGSVLSEFSSYLHNEFVRVKNIGKDSEPNLELSINAVIRRQY